MDDEILNPSTLSDGDDVASADGNNGSEYPDVVELKDLLGQALGKTFNDNESALKSVQDTYKYVSKAGLYKKAIDKVMQTKGLDEKSALSYIMENITQEQIPVEPVQAQPVQQGQNQQAEIADTVAKLQRELREANFYANNPDMKPYKELIDSYGKPPDEVVKMDIFQTIHAKLRAHDENESARSVLQSNPRLGQVTDKIKEAREIAQTDNSSAGRLATEAVIDAFMR